MPTFESRLFEVRWELDHGVAIDLTRACACTAAAIASSETSPPPGSSSRNVRQRPLVPLGRYLTRTPDQPRDVTGFADRSPTKRQA